MVFLWETADMIEAINTPGRHIVATLSEKYPAATGN